MIGKNKKFAIYMEGNLDSDYGKMGFGVMRYSRNPVVCVIDSTFAGMKVNEAVSEPFDIPVVASIKEARNLGADTFVLGIAPSGGKFPDSWDEPLISALSSGMSVINGLHDDLNARFGSYLNSSDDSQKIWDVRKPKDSYPIAAARAAELKNKRVLLVGTDMAVGKMTAGIEIYRWIKKQGISTDFLATGQIGITVTGKGIPLDAIKVDQACGAVESLVMSAADKDIIFVEGQGSLLHPGSTATLPLMRGSCATHLILCHRADMQTLRRPNNVRIPDLKNFIELNEALATVCGSLTKATTVGIALNTSKMEEQAALDYIEEVEKLTGLPTTDVIRVGPEIIGQALLDT